MAGNRGARLGAAAFVVGLSLAGPQALGVAAADTTGSDSSSGPVGPAGAAAQDAQAGSRSSAGRVGRGAKHASPVADQTATPRAAASRASRGSAPQSPAATASPQSTTPHPQSAAAVRTAGVNARAAATEPAAAVDDLRGVGQPIGAAAVVPPGIVLAAGAIAAPAAVGNGDPIALSMPWRSGSAGVVVKPVAAAAAATPAAVQGYPGVLSSIAKLFDGSLNWLNGLPVNPVTDFLSGALLLMRRDLEPTVMYQNPDGLNKTIASSLPINQTFVVNTLADSGTGSLRQAMLDANAAAGADLITFAVAGTVRVGGSALPTVTDSTVINGSTAPGYGGSPVVRIDFENTDGLTLAAGADGSEILGLSLVDAAGAGLTIAASDTTLAGNYIGLWGNGTTVEANRGDGVLVLPGATGNSIGVNSGTDGNPPATFVLSNVISGNRGNGVTIEGNDNTVQASYVGTSASGNGAIGNRGNGIQITAGAVGNLIGGTATGGNDPTNGVFARPPQGNLISGNRGNGVLIDNEASGNQLSGNFIGTNASGNAALGNRQDGVAIVDANANRLVGTTDDLDPFVYYNVLAGNHGNGLRITDSDNTVVWANFFGIGADNSTAVANRGNGLLANGNSQGVLMGGPIPLGNVMSGNARYGIEIADTAGRVVSWNSFVGQSAFGGAVPNMAGGILVTSSNPGFNPTDSSTWNDIRTSLIGGNRGHGIEFRGNAHGVQVTDTASGTNYTIDAPLPNTGSGIVVGGNSSQIAIGGFQPSVEQVEGGYSVHVGSNGGYGIVFRDNAHDSSVFNTEIGIGVGETIETSAALPNGRGGMLIGAGTSGILVGGPLQAPDTGIRYSNLIVGNEGNGVTVRFSKNLTFLGNTIQGNDRSGLVLVGARGAQVGAPEAANFIIGNGGYGVYATGRLDGTAVQASTVTGNGGSGVRLVFARGIAVGGIAAGRNLIADNDGWGIFANGWSRGSALLGNTVIDNQRGALNTWATVGLQVSSADSAQQSGGAGAAGTSATGAPTAPVYFTNRQPTNPAPFSSPTASATASANPTLAGLQINLIGPLFARVATTNRGVNATVFLETLLIGANSYLYALGGTQGMQLYGAPLANANLLKANLSYADLSQANLANANLSSANLSYANLQYASLANGTLVTANLANALLSNANLSNANLSYADLNDANLTGTSLNGANLTGVNWTGATLTGVNFTGATCPNGEVYGSGGNC